MARIIPLYPKKEAKVRPPQTEPNRKLLPEEIEKLRTSILGDLLKLFGAIVRKLLIFPHKQWMTEEQVQLKLKISAKDLRKLSDLGKIPFEEVCGDYYYDAKAVARMQRRQKRLKPG